MTTEALIICYSQRHFYLLYNQPVLANFQGSGEYHYENNIQFCQHGLSQKRTTARSAGKMKMTEIM